MMAVDEDDGNIQFAQQRHVQRGAHRQHGIQQHRIHRQSAGRAAPGEGARLPARRPGGPEPGQPNQHRHRVHLLPRGDGPGDPLGGLGALPLLPRLQQRRPG